MNAKKILFISNIIGNGIGAFSLSSIYAANELEMEYHMAANFNNSSLERRVADEEKFGIKTHHIDFDRNPLKLQNIRAFKQIYELMRQEHFDIVHCNTPIGGIVGRIVGKKCNIEKIIYQAHGFHFYKGAPIKNWLIYYPVERWLARYTDVLITINKEDYEFSRRKMRLSREGKIYYVPGVGLDLSLFKLKKKDEDREKKRKELGLAKDDIMLISAGELNVNKNNRVIIEALSRVKNTKIHYYLCGSGHLETELKELVKKRNVGNNIHFLGYRTDVLELFCASDIFVMPSYREGLSRSIMEAMACGLPCIVSKIRGNVDLIEDKVGGLQVEPEDIDGFVEAIVQLAINENLRCEMSDYNLEKVKIYDLQMIVKLIQEIYIQCM